MDFLIMSSNLHRAAMQDGRSSVCVHVFVWGGFEQCALTPLRLHVI